jgi:hypothetical protein
VKQKDGLIEVKDDGPGELTLRLGSDTPAILRSGGGLRDRAALLKAVKFWESCIRTTAYPANLGLSHATSSIKSLDNGQADPLPSPKPSISWALNAMGEHT